jgi:hypothetical protein
MAIAPTGLGVESSLINVSSLPIIIYVQNIAFLPGIVKSSLSGPGRVFSWAAGFDDAGPISPGLYPQRDLRT